jgi:VWFA-related protein
MRQDYLKYKNGVGLMICLIFLISIASNSWGQSIGEVTINQIEVLSAPEQSGNKISAYVTVSSSDQKTIQGLSVSNFKALEDGIEINIQSVSQTDEPMSVVLAIDTSGSMLAKEKSGKTSMEAAKEAAVEFITMLEDNDRVALFSFNNDTDFHLDFSIDHDTAIETIKGLSAKYQAATRLYDTVLEAVKKASEIPQGRRAVVVLTDGRDEKGGGTCSIHSLNDVIDAATTKTIRVPIYTIGVGPQVDAKELGRIASLTGGRNMIAASISELSGFYRLIAEQLKNQYSVQYITHSPSGEHSLVVKVIQDGNIGQDEKRFWSPPLPAMIPLIVSIVSPETDDSIKGIVDVKAKVTPEEGISRLRYYVDGTLKGEDASPPFKEFKWDAAGLTDGPHLLRVEAVHANGQTGYAETSVRSGSASSFLKNKGLLSILVIIILLLAVTGVFIQYQRKNRKKEKDAPVVTTTVRRVAEPDTKTGPPEEERESPDDVDNEATTMDIQSVLEPLAKLTVIKSHQLELGATFKVLGTTQIGRGTGNNIRIPDKSVSRKHAIINYAGGKFHIRDVNSSYGTKMDDREVKSEGIVINDGAQIQFGNNTIMRFNILVGGKEPGKKEPEKKDETIVYGRE